MVEVADVYWLLFLQLTFQIRLQLRLPPKLLGLVRLLSVGAKYVLWLLLLPNLPLDVANLYKLLGVLMLLLLQLGLIRLLLDDDDSLVRHLLLLLVAFLAKRQPLFLQSFLVKTPLLLLLAFFVKTQPFLLTLLDLLNFSLVVVVELAKIRTFAQTLSRTSVSHAALADLGLVEEFVQGSEQGLCLVLADLHKLLGLVHLLPVDVVDSVVRLLLLLQIGLYFGNHLLLVAIANHAVVEDHLKIVGRFLKIGLVEHILDVLDLLPLLNLIVGQYVLELVQHLTLVVGPALNLPST